MNRSSVIEKVQQLLEHTQIGSYSRYDGEHPYDIFLGIDDKGRKSLVVTLKATREKPYRQRRLRLIFLCAQTVDIL